MMLFRMSGESHAFVFELKGPWKSWADLKDRPQGSQSSSDQYHFGLGQSSRDQGNEIDINQENQAVIRYIQYFKENYQEELKVFIVPGYSKSDVDKPVGLSEIAKLRLNSLSKLLMKFPGSIVFLTGGNVHPDNTPFNEAIEMKKHIMKVHKIPEFLIAVDPNAQNTVTNLRNAGRFLRTFGISQGTIVTTLVQNIYVSFPKLTGFSERSKNLLGYEVGSVEMNNLKTATFSPSEKVLQKSNSKLDP